MQDRFKFRVWSKKYNKFIEDNRYPIGSDYQLIITQGGTLIKLGLGDFEDDCEDSYSWATFKDYEQDCIVMQCTGLKNKNGKLIYEGDILYNPFSNYKYVVNFGKFTLNYTKPFSVNITGFYITYKENLKNEIDSLQMLDLNNIEVIGNIYENPELLED